MNNTLKVLLGISGVCITNYYISSGIKKVKNNAMNKSKEEYSKIIDDSISKEKEWLKAEIANAEDIYRKRSNYTYNKFQDWVSDTNYFNKLKEVKNNYAESIKQFKEEIDYNSKRKLYSDGVDQQLRDWRDAYKYDSNLNSINEKIEKIKTDYKKTKNSMSESVLSDDILDAIEKEKDKKLSDLNQEKEKLINAFNSFKKEVNKDKLKKLKKLDAKLTEKIAKEKTKTDIAVKKLNNQADEIRTLASDEFMESLSENEKKTLEHYRDNKSRFKSILKHEKVEIENICVSMPFEKKLGLYLRDTNTSPIIVATIGSIPMILLVTAGCIYLNKLSNVMNYMKSDGGYIC